MIDPVGLTPMQEHMPGLWERYPGHLHIDILKDYQGHGYGRKLMDAFLHRLAKSGCSGVHLGMAASNEGAAKFYEALGFERYPEVLDGGKSGGLHSAEGSRVDDLTT